MTQFKINLDLKYFNKNDTLNVGGTKLKLITQPKKIDKWWWKIVRFLTFGRFCKPQWTYMCEVL